MITQHYGEFAALLVAIFWSVTALAFEAASRKVGSLPVNIIRLVMALFFLTVLNYITRGLWFPSDASTHNWIWLSISGLIGFVLGDFFLFKSYNIIGSWFAMLIMTLAPPLAALFGFFILGEHLKPVAIIGIAVTLTGIVVAMFRHDKESRKFIVSKPVIGMLYAFGGALGQALGIVFSKYGMLQYNAFAATQIRIIVGIAGFIILITLMGKWQSVRNALKNSKALWYTSVGSFFGPFLGVSFSLVAVQHTNTGVASTIMAMVPIFLILPNMFLFKRRITIQEIIGTVISLCGVVLFFR
jgi:drug/metabolite transporter (DMT)-like permease